MNVAWLRIYGFEGVVGVYGFAGRGSAACTTEQLSEASDESTVQSLQAVTATFSRYMPSSQAKQVEAP